MARSVQILLSFIIQMSNGEDFSVEQLVGAIIIMVTIIVTSSERQIIENRPILGKSLPKCRCRRSDKQQSNFDIEAVEDEEELSQDLKAQKEEQKLEVPHEKECSNLARNV